MQISGTDRFKALNASELVADPKDGIPSCIAGAFLPQISLASVVNQIVPIAGHGKIALDPRRLLGGRPSPPR